MKLIHERYAEEVAQGLHEKKKPKPAATGKRGSKKAALDGESPGMFD